MPQSAPLRPHRVAVIGPGECDPTLRSQAEQIGMLLAQAGIVVICGGLGGCMEAVASGCQKAGGWSIGFLPQQDTHAAAAALTLPLATGLGEARNVLVVGTAEVVIAIGGGAGTLSELGLALKLNKPIVALETWQVEPPHGAPSVRIEAAHTPEEAVEKVCALLKHGASNENRRQQP